MAKQFTIFVGMKFTSRNFDGVAEVMTIEEEKDKANVKITRSSIHETTEEMILSEMYDEFEKANHSPVYERPDVGKHGQMELEGEYAD